jgi:predicted deacylase
MHTHIHHLGAEDCPAAYQLQSLHFGAAGKGRKAYIQASLHADEVPAMLVAQSLRRDLERLEREGRIRGEVVLVPAANPIGLAQAIQGTPFGRFDLGSGANFNRSFEHLAEALKTSLEGKLGADPVANVALVREHAHRALAKLAPRTATEELKKVLLSLAIDADIVLDLHCDNEAVMHMYTGTPLAARMLPLAALLDARALLTARDSGGFPFDEACSRLWWELAEHFGDATPLPPACAAATIELRGEMDVSYALADGDAQAILQFLAREEVLDIPAAPLPAPRCAPTPLEGVEPLYAPHSGILVFHRRLGSSVEAGDPVADIVNPVSGKATTLRAGAAGTLFASTAHRHLLRGMHVCKIAGALPFRTGELLSQ